MTKQFAIDPEVRQLLREIAGADGGLLRVAPEDVGRTLFDADPRVSSTTAFLKRAERRLLDVHRQEVAELLHLFGHLVRAERGALGERHHFRDETVPESVWAALGRRSEQALRLSEHDELDREAVHLLTKLAGGDQGLTAARVMTAELRMLPSDNARIALAADLYGEGREAESTALLNEVLRFASDEARSYVHEHQGLRSSRNGDYARATQEYRLSAELESSRIVPALAWLGAAVQADRPEDISAAIERVDASIDPDGRALAWYVKAQAHMRAKGEWSPTPKALRLVRNVYDSAGPAARSVLDVFS